VQRRIEIINGFLLKPMTVRRRKFIVVMHKGGLIMRVDMFGDLIIQLGEMKVEIPDGLTIFVSDVIVLP
jgi:hypothetical protein